MDKKAKLSSARKKLKNFRRARENKTHSNTSNLQTEANAGKEVTNLSTGVNQPTIAENAASGTDYHDSPETHSTAGSAESILQVSSTLNGIIAEVESLTEAGVGVYSSGSQNKAGSEYSNSSENISTLVDDTIKDLQKRNIELMEKVGMVEVEREQWKAHCQHLSDQINTLSLTNSKSEATHSQLEAQKQTIEILVSEKQDLQRQVTDLKLKSQSSNAEQMVLQETLQNCKKQIDAYEIELSQKSQLITSMELTIDPLKTECENYREESTRVGQAFEKEKLQTSELSMKLNVKETEFNQLLASHADMQEKLSMAEVLLQQYSSRKDDISVTAKLEAENRHLSLDLQNSHAALEKLADERDHIIRQHSDSQKDWINHTHQLQLEIQELQDALENAKKISELAEHTAPAPLPQNVTPAEVTVTTSDNFSQTDNFFEETIAALSNNNRQLSQLMHEKESQIQQLENELLEAKTVIQGHENLLDSSRNDKVTISRALTQNKQLKEQLEEIQDSFVIISNDKMDLATQLDTMESVNRSLSGRLQEITDAFNVAKQDLENQRRRMAALEEYTPVKTPEILPIDETPMNESEAEISSDDTDEYIVVDSPTVDEPGIATPHHEAGNETPDFEAGNKTPDHETGNETPVHEAGKEISEENEIIPLPVLEAEKAPLPLDSEQNQNKAKMMEMLQEKFTSVMQERADLLNRVEMLEHANTQLQNECDTIGEYITLYHNQRQLLKKRHQEKDVYISTIIQEREEMRGKVEQLQTLVGTVLKSSTQTSNSNDIANQRSREPLNSDSDVVLPQPNLPLETSTLAGEPLPSVVEQVPATDSNYIRSGVDDLAAQQILSLLKQMQKPAEAPPPTYSRPSGFCMRYTGPYTAI